MRVVGLNLHIARASDWRHLSQLSALRAVFMDVHANALRAEVDAFHIPTLEVLEVFPEATSGNPHFERFVGVVIGRHHKLQTITIVPGKYKEFEFSLASWCNLTDLRDIHVPDMNIHDVPACFGHLRKLRNVYMSCNYLKMAPVALTGLPELRSFIAFRQGEVTPCHFDPLENSLPEVLRGVQREDCKATWESRAGLDGDDNYRLLCPSLAIRGTLQDFMALGWSKLEKLWLDGNFIGGSIPPDLPVQWPKLVSLDLYDNEISGEIPDTLGQLPFEKLQLQSNHLRGAVPPSLFKLPACTFRLQGNSELEGCVPDVVFKGIDVARSAAYIGTRTRICEGDLAEL